MIKKENSFFISAVISFFILVFFSCTSHEQKADDGFDRFKEEKLVLKDSNNSRRDTIQTPQKSVTVKKVEITDVWTLFVNEMKKKILANSNKIKVLKGIPNANVKLLRKVAGLEKENNDLRRQMDEYNEEMKVQREKFIVKMNHDANIIDIDLKDLTISNRK